MRNNNKIYTLIIVLLFSAQALASSNELISVGPSKSHMDCTGHDKERNKSSENYNKYAGCVINNKFDIFNSIYKRHLRKNPKDTGEILIGASVNKVGKITKTEVIKTSIKSERLLRVIKARLKSIQLSAPNDDGTYFKYNFNFK